MWLPVARQLACPARPGQGPRRLAGMARAVCRPHCQCQRTRTAPKTADGASCTALAACGWAAGRGLQVRAHAGIRSFGNLKTTVTVLDGRRAH